MSGCASCRAWRTSPPLLVEAPSADHRAFCARSEASGASAVATRFRDTISVSPAHRVGWSARQTTTTGTAGCATGRRRCTCAAAARVRATSSAVNLAVLVSITNAGPYGLMATWSMSPCGGQGRLWRARADRFAAGHEPVRLRVALGIVGHVVGRDVRKLASAPIASSARRSTTAASSSSARGLRLPRGSRARPSAE